MLVCDIKNMFCTMESSYINAQVVKNIYLLMLSSHLNGIQWELPHVVVNVMVNNLLQHEMKKTTVNTTGNLCDVPEKLTLRNIERENVLPHRFALRTKKLKLVKYLIRLWELARLSDLLTALNVVRCERLLHIILIILNHLRLSGFVTNVIQIIKVWVWAYTYKLLEGKQ